MAKLHSVWEAEIHPTPVESKKKKEDLEKGKAEWEAASDAFIEKQRKKRESERRELSQDTAESSPPRAASPKTRREITEEIERINRSGLALIPFAVFPTELSKTLNPTGLSAFASFFDKSGEKAAIFDLIKEAFGRYRKSE